MAIEPSEIALRVGPQRLKFFESSICHQYGNETCTTQHCELHAPNGFVRGVGYRREVHRSASLSLAGAPTPGVRIHRLHNPHAVQELVFGHRVNSGIGGWVIWPEGMAVNLWQRRDQR